MLPSFTLPITATNKNYVRIDYTIYFPRIIHKYNIAKCLLTMNPSNSVPHVFVKCKVNANVINNKSVVNVFLVGN